MNSKVTTVARYLLGIAMLVFGANKFLHFMPNPPLPADAGAFMGALAESGYIFPIYRYRIYYSWSLFGFKQSSAFCINNVSACIN